eukprot:TRINITY_DN45668_c0_g1_i1.p1 TRINITY_DN45668_c0_g1~~TRINITY_DN45668_c0_g1_i1.p1  ORF type:complete len:254 (+),score=31.78 TRINITY_DN45668_c0_g1_i1:46-807(+)
MHQMQTDVMTEKETFTIARDVIHGAAGSVFFSHMGTVVYVTVDQPVIVSDASSGSIFVSVRMARFLTPVGTSAGAADSCTEIEAFVQRALSAVVLADRHPSCGFTVDAVVVGASNPLAVGPVVSVAAAVALATAGAELRSLLGCSLYGTHHKTDNDQNARGIESLVWQAPPPPDATASVAVVVAAAPDGEPDTKAVAPRAALAHTSRISVAVLESTGSVTPTAFAMGANAAATAAATLADALSAWLVATAATA